MTSGQGGIGCRFALSRFLVVIGIAGLFGCAGARGLGVDDTAVEGTSEDADDAGSATLNIASLALTSALGGGESGLRLDRSKGQTVGAFKSTFSAASASTCIKKTLGTPTGKFFSGSIAGRVGGSCAITADGDSSGALFKVNCDSYDEGEASGNMAFGGNLFFEASVSGSLIDLELASDNLTVKLSDGQNCSVGINFSAQIERGEDSDTLSIQEGCLSVCGESFSLSGSDTKAGRVVLYNGFEDDLEAILARDDNTKRGINESKRIDAVERVKSFADLLGLQTADLVPDQRGRLVRSLLIPNSKLIDKYFHYTPASAPLSLEDELLVVRKTWSDEPGFSGALSEDKLQEIAEKLRSDLGIPLTDSTDTPNFAASTQLRIVEEVDSEQAASKILRQTVGYFRRVGERQVTNSLFQVDIDPAKSLVVGLSLRNWWGLKEAESASLKDLATLKKDVILTFLQNGSENSNISVTKCWASYYQLPSVLVPSATCSGVLVDDDVILTSDPIVLSVSLTAEVFLNDGDVYVTTVTEEEDPDPLPTDNGDLGGSRFGVYYTTDETRFYQGVDAFRDRFDNKWSDYDGPRWAYHDYFTGSSNALYAENADLLYVVTHGAVRGFTGQDEKIWFNSPTDPVAQLGVGDVEYVTHAGCHLGGAIYCEGRSAVSRYTDTNSRDSVFTGLHIFSSNHGTGISNNTIHRNKADTYAQYLIDGLTLIEAWESAEVDTRDWYDNYETGCYEIYDAPTGCNMDGTGFTCDRYGAYPASFYLKTKRNETIDNRGDYTSDPRKGDADYDIDLIYRYQSETVPISASGYSLP